MFHSTQLSLRGIEHFIFHFMRIFLPYHVLHLQTFTICVIFVTICFQDNFSARLTTAKKSERKAMDLGKGRGHSITQNNWILNTMLEKHASFRGLIFV